MEDNGRGLDPAIRNRIFEPFFTTGRSKGGAGLGLHISCQLAVATLGGTLSLNEATTAGAGFNLEIPLGVTRRLARCASWMAGARRIRRSGRVCGIGESGLPYPKGVHGADVDGGAAITSLAERPAKQRSLAWAPVDLATANGESGALHTGPGAAQDSVEGIELRHRRLLRHGVPPRATRPGEVVGLPVLPWRLDPRHRWRRWGQKEMRGSKPGRR